MEIILSFPEGNLPEDVRFSWNQKNGCPITEFEWKAKFNKTLLKIKKEDDCLILNIDEEYVRKQ